MARMVQISFLWALFVGSVGCEAGGEACDPQCSQGFVCSNGGCVTDTGGSTGLNSQGNSSGDPGPGTAGDPGAGTAGDPDAWEDMLKGRHIQVYYSGSDGDSSSTGSVYITGGETYDLYLCSDMTMTGSYEDTTCVSVYIPLPDGGGMSSNGDCDGDYVQQQGSGTWKVQMVQGNVPALVVSVQGMETLYFALGSDGNSFYIDGLEALFEGNPYCN